MVNQETEEKKSIWYDGKMRPFSVFQIPLENLIYNKHNGRIKSIVKSFETGLGRELNPKDKIDKNIIESFLYDSAEYRNEKTIQSLRDYGQQEIGIVTKDMIIIDGNRRASLLSKIYREDKSINYFKAIILPDDLIDKRFEIIKLETNYQMGVDNKVEYKPIEKYLRCKELANEFDLSFDEIGKLMSEKSNRIIQWLNILSLMEEYLEYLNSPNVYTRLDKKEGHFVDLYNYVNKYKSNNNPNIEELKKVYFDYIRLGLPVQRLRVIGNPNNSMSLFAKKDYWISFYDRHLEVTKSFDEKNFKTLKKEHLDKSNEEIFNKLDFDFKLNLEENLKDNLISGEIFIKNLNEKKSTLKELNRIIKYFQDMNINGNISSEKDEIKKLLDIIIEKAISLKKEL